MTALELLPLLREVTGADEDWLLTRRPEPFNVPAACHTLLARCLGRDDTGDVRALGLAERDWLLVQLRWLTFGSRIRAEARCPRCHAAAEAEFLTSELPLSPTPPEPLVVTLRGGRVVRLRALTAGDHERFAGSRAASDAEQVRATLEAAVGDLSALTDEERSVVESALAASVPEPVTLDIPCPECGERIRAPFDPCEFVLAEMRQHARTLVDDVHVLASRYGWTQDDVCRLPVRRRTAYLMKIEAEDDVRRVLPTMEVRR